MGTETGREYKSWKIPTLQKTRFDDLKSVALFSLWY